MRSGRAQASARRRLVDDGKGVRGDQRRRKASANGEAPVEPELWSLESEASGSAIPGVVVRAYGKFFDVEPRDESRILLSTLKGTLKRERRRTDLVAVGDRVWVTDVGEGEGVIEAVEPRTRVLARLARHTEDIEQVILANPDQALFVFAVREPEPHRRMLDRFLVLAESRELPARIAINKMDLVRPDAGDDGDSPRTKFDDYRAIYPVHFVSAVTGEGVADLRESLIGKVTVIAGPSGVGKSRLLNVLHPAIERAVGDISAATGKGRHTTTATQLYRIAPDSYVADTPGIRAIALQGVTPEALDWCFPEFRPFLGECFYHDCTHLHEPGCAVQDAVGAGAISAERYASYASLWRGDQDD